MLSLHEHTVKRIFILRLDRAKDWLSWCGLTPRPSHVDIGGGLESFNYSDNRCRESVLNWFFFRDLIELTRILRSPDHVWDNGF